MIEKELESVVAHLAEALQTLDVAGIEDERIMSRYVEYLVALQLTKQGHETQIH